MAKKLILMKGLPGSGKSTVAQKIVDESNGQTYRVNRDLLRNMLFFGKWHAKKEMYVIEAEKTISKLLLDINFNVVIDDTNLGKSHEDMWKAFAEANGATFEVNFVDTPLETCIERDSKRDKKVGRSVIVGMAMKYGMYKPSKVVLCDIDGTIADGKHRNHHVEVKEGQKKDWKTYFSLLGDDTLITDTVQQVYQKINQGCELFYVSARPEDYRKETEAWLKKVGAPIATALFMRPKGDSREDSIVKKELLDRYFPDTKIIDTIFDDRPRVIRMWRENGLNVVDCGDGIDF